MIVSSGNTAPLDEQSSTDNVPSPGFNAPPRRPIGKGILRVLRRLSGIVALIALWQVATNAGLIDPRKFPPPSAVVKALISLEQLGRLWPDVAASLQRVIVGFALATVVGVGMGLLLARNRFLSEYLLPIVEVLRPISVLAWIPLAVIWFGIGDPTAWFIIFLGAFFPIFSNAYLGARSIDRTHYNASRSLGAGRWLFITDVLWPTCTPYILAGMRIGLGVGWMCVIAAELVAAQSGLGYMIQLARTLIDTEDVMAGMVVIGILGYLMNLTMTILERRLTPWRSHDQRD